MESPIRRERGGPEAAKLQRGLSLEPGDDLWSWFEVGALNRPRETEEWTRFEGLEGLSDAVVRGPRDG